MNATILHRIAPCPNKMFSCSSDASSRVARPFLRITEAEMAAILTISQGSDVVLLDGYTQATLGLANGYPALMPLTRPLS